MRAHGGHWELGQEPKFSATTNNLHWAISQKRPREDAKQLGWPRKKGRLRWQNAIGLMILSDQRAELIPEVVILK